MKYADLAVPSRALHLWRYTPWARIHPSSVESVPDATPVRFSLIEGGAALVDGAPRIVDGDDIAVAAQFGDTHNRAADSTKPVNRHAWESSIRASGSHLVTSFMV